MDILGCTTDYWTNNETECLENLRKDMHWNKVPLLNANELHDFRDCQLVRFRGMIQDMHGPEYYLEEYKVVCEDSREKIETRYGKYKEILECKTNETILFEDPSTIRGERETYVVISTPGLNEWVKKKEKDLYKIKPEHSPSSSALNKRPSGEAMDTDEPSELTTKKDPESSNTTKKQCSNANNKPLPSNVVSREYLLNFPIPDSSGMVCLVKTYSTESIKLNSLCEFVGFLSVSPTLALDNLDEDITEEIELQTHNPPASLIPRIHCVDFKYLTHNNPLMELETPFDSGRMAKTYKNLHSLFTNLFFGDQLTAEFLIYNLISHIYFRDDFTAIGKFSMNISNVPKFEDVDIVQELYKIVQLLVQKSHYIAMSLRNMNELSIVPKKDYTANRLTSSNLQLSSNTHVILDETKLSEGKLNEAGVDGVRILNNALKNQKIKYDFVYYQIEFDCDLPFVIFSDGKSMLSSDVHVAMQPPEENLLMNYRMIVDGAFRNFLIPDQLDDIRIYLTQARLTKFEIPEDIKEDIGTEFLDMRKTGCATADDLHFLLVLARLVSIAKGKNSLDMEDWKKAVKLEESRKDRNKKITSSNK